MKQTTNAARIVVLSRPLAVLVCAAGLTLASCTGNGAGPSAPSPPVVSPAPQAEPQSATLEWASSMCQSLALAFDQLDASPPLDPGNLAATRQAHIGYLTNARNAVQQANERLSSAGAPPVPNGQEVFDKMRNQLTQMHGDLDRALEQLKETDPNDVAAIGLALGSAGNALSAFGNRAQVFGDLALEPQLRAAIDQTPECQDMIGVDAGTTAPTGPPQPPG